MYIYVKVTWQWCDPVWWPILRISALHLSHPKCTHTAVNTHLEQCTHTQQWTHTAVNTHPEQCTHTHTVNTHLEQCTRTAVNTHTVNTHTWSSAHTQQCTHTHTVNTHPEQCTHTVNTHPEQCTHTHTHTHTHTLWTHTRSSAHTQCTHTWSSGSSAGEQLGVRCLAQGHLVVVLKVESALDIHSPHRQSLPDRDSNPQPLDYESGSLTIRPRLSHIYICVLFKAVTPFSSTKI